MSKITLNTVGSLIDATTAVVSINSNFATIQTAFDNTFSLDGTSPNQLRATLDTNSFHVINLPQPATANEPLRFRDLNSFIGGGTITNIPPGGGAGAILVKTSALDYQVGWGTVAAGLLAGSNISISGSPIATIATTQNPNFTTSVTTPLLVLNGTSLSAFTGTGSIVLNTSPTLVTPALGTPSSGVLTNCTGLPLASVTGLGTGVATFLATPSSANLISAVTDETGTGALVFANTPTLVTPVLGAATATTINKVTITAPATAAILTIANNKTFTVNNSIAFTGTDSTVLTLPPITDTIPGLNGTNTWVGANTFPNNGGLRIFGSSSGITSFASANASASSFTVTFPAITGTVAVATNVTKQTFSATGTYTPTANMAHCIIECWGGGGGGGGSAGTGASNQSSAGGGGAGAYARTYSTAAAIGASKAVTIGAAGTGGAAGNNAGVAGGSTSVGVLCIAPGGSGGGGTGGSSGASGGTGGTGATGDVVGSGMNGFSAVGGATFVTIGFAGGAGGSSSIGGGGASPNITGAGGFNGNAASGWGAGGSGGSSFNSATTASGGNGSQGLVVITEFINV